MFSGMTTKWYTVTVRTDNGVSDKIVVRAQGIDIHNGILSLVEYRATEIEDHGNPQSEVKEVRMAYPVALFAAGTWMMVREEL